MKRRVFAVLYFMSIILPLIDLTKGFLNAFKKKEKEIDKDVKLFMEANRGL